MDERLNVTINKIAQLCAQNPEFNSALRKRLGLSSTTVPMSVDDERINQIYEYCIEKVVHRQAQEFYKDFPLTSAIDTLVEDFCRMETFHRKDCFGDFCLSVYQQIECMTNKLCVNPDLNVICERMWGYPAYVKTGADGTPSVDMRSASDYSIASLVFWGANKKTGLLNAVEKSKQSLQSLYAIDKIRTIVYFLGYKGAMKSSDYDSYRKFTSLLSDLYQCRNMNHRGNEQTPREKETLDRVQSHRAEYYLKFLGALTLYVEQIKEGWNNLPMLKEYAKSLTPILVKPKGPKILGQINLPEDNKKRFK